MNFYEVFITIDASQVVYKEDINTSKLWNLLNFVTTEDGVDIVIYRPNMKHELDVMLESEFKEQCNSIVNSGYLSEVLFTDKDYIQLKKGRGKKSNG